MQILILVIFILIGIIVSLVIYSKIKKDKIIKNFQGNYHNFENEDFEYENLKFIRRYWDNKKTRENPKFYIDDTTWNDLNMDHLFFKMDATQTSVGEEYLYAKLRSVNFDLESLKRFGEKIDFIDKNKDIKIKSLYFLHNLGRDLYNGVYDFIFNAKDVLLKNMYIYYILMTLPIVSLIICLFTKTGFLLLIVAIFVNTIFYNMHKYIIDINLNSVRYLKRIIVCGTKLSKLDYGDEEYKNNFMEIMKPISKITFISNMLGNVPANEIEALFEYIKTVLMLDFINYNRMVKLLIKYTEEFHSLYKIIGEIDTVISISEYRKTLPFYSKPIFEDTSDVMIEDIYHPLVKRCVTNSINIDKNIILTGSNASGKSTFIKSLALTMILSQNLYMCFSKKYIGKMSFVITSMAVKDDVLNNESYFIAEIKSLKRVLDSLNDEIRIICFIDEILKGTNTIERVAASSSILNFLKDKNCKVITASHDIELTEIMRNFYDNYHFKEDITDAGLTFTYKLLQGHATTKNAILLLKFIGYDKKITENADKLSKNYIENRKWDVIK